MMTPLPSALTGTSRCGGPKKNGKSVDLCTAVPETSIWTTVGVSFFATILIASVNPTSSLITTLSIGAWSCAFPTPGLNTIPKRKNMAPVNKKDAINIIFFRCDILLHLHIHDLSDRSLLIANIFILKEILWNTISYLNNTLQGYSIRLISFSAMVKHFLTTLKHFIKNYTITEFILMLILRI